VTLKACSQYFKQERQLSQTNRAVDFGVKVIQCHW